MVSGTDDDGTGIWDLERRRPGAAFPPISAHAFSPDGRLLAGLTEGGSIGLFDPRSGRRVAALGAGMDGAVLRFSPDGRVLAALATRTGASDDFRTTLELWDVPGRRPVVDEPLFDFGETYAESGTLAFSPDGRMLVVTGMEVGGSSEPMVIDLDADRWAERACELATSCGATPDAAASAARG